MIDARYTDRKVHKPLADKLGDKCPITLDTTRFSLESLAGAAAQREGHCNVYRDDPDIARVSQIPAEAWDPKNVDLARRHGITWVTMSDIHHDAVGDKPFAAVVHVGDVVFLSISLSSTILHIKRADGDDLNGATQLIISVLNHFPSLRQIRFTEDTTRANRDSVGWSMTVKRCEVRNINMVFGGQSYDPSDPGDALTLAALSMVGTRDDPVRRRRLTGKRLMKYKTGGAALAEAQMPLGWLHKRDQFGRQVRDDQRGLVPKGDSVQIPVVQALYEGHAAGESYQQLAQRLVAFESEGLLARRDHRNPGNSYASAVDDGLAMYDAAKSIFEKSTDRPATMPDEDAINRYLAGAEPSDVFDSDTLFYLGKVELVRTGRYYRRLKNDIRGRNIVLDGIPATYQNDLDEYGRFDVLSAPWAWPLDDRGDEVPSFGLSDDTCRQVGARLLRELRGPRGAAGGRAHHKHERRAIQAIENWFAEPNTPDAVYDDEPTEWGVEARQNTSSASNFILLHRRASATTGARCGWSNLGPGEKKPDHIAATGSLRDLCASVATQLDLEVRTLLTGDEVARVNSVPETTQTVDPTAALDSKAALKRLEAEDLEAKARSQRDLAALAHQDGDLEEVAAYRAQAKRNATEAATLRQAVAQLEKKVDDARSRAHTVERDDLADLSVAAYLVAGLERASGNNGLGPDRLGSMVDAMVGEWRFRPLDDEELAWSCHVKLPLVSGGEAVLPLSGVIRDVRTRPGKQLANTRAIARYVFEEGRQLDAVADLLDVTRKTLLVKRVMPWLVEHGVTARGAKCALVDHPYAAVRREIYAAAAQADSSTFLSPFQSRLRKTYFDPDLRWGDGAVPDDIGWIDLALGLLTAGADTKRHGLPVLDLALQLGKTEPDIRELVKPQHRSGGFTRPRYLEYTDATKTHVKAIGCPHGKCKNRRYADHVALLPEVAASGYGVICRNCRRAPALHDTWPLTQFPSEYLERWTGRGAGGSLRSEAQTVLLST